MNFRPHGVTIIPNHIGGNHHEKAAFRSCLPGAALRPGVPASAAYSDVTGSLAAEVEKAVDYGLMNGYSADTFGYSDSVTRAQFVTVVGRMLGWFDAGQPAQAYITPQMQVPQDIATTYWTAISAAEKAIRYSARIRDGAVDHRTKTEDRDPITTPKSTIVPPGLRSR